jgi:hypothetical protein
MIYVITAAILLAVFGSSAHFTPASYFPFLPQFDHPAADFRADSHHPYQK